MNRKQVEQIVDGYKTESERGFSLREIHDISAKFEIKNKEKFGDALRGVTCTTDMDKIRIYRCDVITAILCGIEDRDMHGYEFD